MADFIHTWKSLIEHYKNIQIRQQAILELLKQNDASHELIEEEMNKLIAIYERNCE